MTRRQVAAYVFVLTACLLLSLAAGWTTFSAQIDNDVYDFLFRTTAPPPEAPHSVVLGVDERSLSRLGGIRGIRRIVAEGLEQLPAYSPRAVVLDLLLPEPGDPADDARLDQAMAHLPNLVLATGLTLAGEWDDPLPRFRAHAAAVGHVHADPDPYDNVLRRVALEKISQRRRYWALALEAFRLDRQAAIVEEPDALFVGGLRIVARREDSRPLFIRYRPALPAVSFWELHNHAPAAEGLRGKVVIVGITAQSAAQDRHMTPYSYGRTMPGVEIHANAFETLAGGAFLVPVRDSSVVLVCVMVCAMAGCIFAFPSGWLSYALAAFLLAAVHAAPWFAFERGLIFPYSPLFATAWLSLAGAASFQHFAVRRLLGLTAAEKSRYQQAIHFVAHEMRTPLQAIQGSSELMRRYQLPDNKRTELAQTINAESKRLARMIQTFLDVERLSAKQLELKNEPNSILSIVDICINRARLLAERKQIAIECELLPEVTVSGDRELLEYAIYNLLTNAIKYSPEATRVTVSGQAAGGILRLAIRDQGIGMDDKELKQIFTKFYRTRTAEATGEGGAGIGLSLVDQIVTHHRGRLEVSSRPGEGSCFTIVLPVIVPRETPEQPAGRPAAQG